MFLASRGPQNILFPEGYIQKVFYYKLSVKKDKKHHKSFKHVYLIKHFVAAQPVKQKGLIVVGKLFIYR